MDGTIGLLGPGTRVAGMVTGVQLHDIGVVYRVSQRKVSLRNYVITVFLKLILFFETLCTTL